MTQNIDPPAIIAPAPVQNLARTKFIRELATKCKNLNSILGVSILLASEFAVQGYGQGSTNPITPADLPDILADLAPQEIDAVVGFINQVQTLLAQPIMPGGPTPLQLIQKLARRAQ